MTSPAEIVARLDEAAIRHETPCGAGRMVWREWGAGPPLVLLHGGHGSWRHWLANIPGLAMRYRVLAADMPGYGDSDDAPERPTAEGLAAILSRGLDEIAADAATRTIVGFSFGGVIGGHVGRLQGAHLERLVLVGSGGLGLTRPPIEPLKSWRRLADPAARAAAHRRNLEILMIHDRRRIDDLAVHLQSENTIRARVNSRPISATDTLRRCLHELAVPIAGIWGEFDATVGPYLAEREALLRSIDPEAEFTAIAGAGHWVQYEAPERFNETLLAIADRRRVRG